MGIQKYDIIVSSSTGHANYKRKTKHKKRNYDTLKGANEKHDDSKLRGFPFVKCDPAHSPTTFCY